MTSDSIYAETAAFAPHGNLLASGGDDGYLNFWSVPVVAGAASDAFPIDIFADTIVSTEVWSAAFSPDQAHIAVGGGGFSDGDSGGEPHDLERGRRRATSVSGEYDTPAGTTCVARLFAAGNLIVGGESQLRAASSSARNKSGFSPRRLPHPVGGIRPIFDPLRRWLGSIAASFGAPSSWAVACSVWAARPAIARPWPARAPSVEPKPAHQLRDPATWPAEPEVPAPIDAARFQAAYAHLCKRGARFAQGGARGADPDRGRRRPERSLHAGRARLLRQPVRSWLSQGRSLRPPGDRAGDVPRGGRAGAAGRSRRC